MKFKSLYTGLLAAAVLMAGCNKYDFDQAATGESLNTFKLSAPANNTNLVLNAATPNAPVVISWTASKPGVSVAPTYKWVAALKSGNIDQPILELPSDNSGKDPKLSLTHKAIDDALKAKGIADGAKTDLIWSVVAENGTTKLRSDDVFGISITRFKDGATPFTLFSPTSSTTPLAIDPGATNKFINFRWTRSLPAAGGAAIKYKVLFAERKLDGAGNELPVNWNSPIFQITSNNAGVDTFANVSYKQISDSLNAKGFTNLSLSNNLKWMVVASSGTWNQFADFSNTLILLREVRVYMAGSFQGWDPGTGPEMIRDMRSAVSNQLYYTYMFLPAGTLFKFTQGRAWDVNYGGTGGTLSPGGANIEITTAGWYRISMDRDKLTYNITTGRMGFVGGATGAGWNPPSVFPTYAMAPLSNNLFLGITNLNVDAWKLIDNDQWNNGSNNVAETRSYGTAGASGSTLEVNGPNFGSVSTAGRYRVIWDGRNPDNVKYEMSPATEMRVVGDGINQAGVNDWDPGSSPQMAYTGNGVWTITLTLKGGKDIKFLAGNAWGAFDYEDAGGGKIKWDGGSNFKTPASAGSYTITLNEYAGTVTIN